MAQSFLHMVNARPRLALLFLCLALYLPGIASLPPLDRDESRFAQASKQMLESGDFVDIRFQDEPRYKKPVGIYWLQAASAAALTAPPHGEIWAYRVPSTLGAFAAVLLAFEIGLVLFNPQAALIGAGLLAASAGLVAEAHIAKTDAVLLACVLASLWGLAKLYLARRNEQSPRWSHALALWAGLGLGLLVKGPLALLIVALVAFGLALWDRDWKFLLTLKPLAGLAVLAFIVLPWALAIYFHSGFAFFHDALIGDLGAKLLEGKERHGGPPLYYLALLSLTFWPGIVALLPAALSAWRERASPAFRFLLVWAVPAWLIFELMPTKLPHYVLPLYPALALAAGAWLAKADKSVLARLSVVLFALVGLALAAALVLLPRYYGEGASLSDFLAAIPLGLATLAVAAAAWRSRWQNALPAAIVLSAALYAALLEGAVPRLSDLQLSPRAAALVAETGGGPVAAAGYAEPSLVFLLGTKTRLGPAEKAADLLAAAPRAKALVAGAEREKFEAAASARGLRLEILGEVSGLNYSRGRRLTLTLFKAAAP